jgi:hypothetical protein
MIHRQLPSDQRIVDLVFSISAIPRAKKSAWLLSMIATYGKTPKQLKGFTWNKDNTINILSKKRPVRPLHPQWVFLFQLKEKQPSNLEGCWAAMTKDLKDTIDKDTLSLSIEHLLLSYKVRKICYAPLKQQLLHLTPSY